MRRKILTAAAVCLALLAGCAKTPEEPIVKKKTGQSLEAYTAVEETERTDTLSAQLQVPETYTADVTSEDGKFHLKCEAAVEVPETDQVGIYKVSQLPFDDALVSQLTKGFFGNAPVYDGTEYFRMTKEDVLKELEKLKKYQAEGNLDPHGYLAAMEESGETFNPDEVYSLQREIDGWEAEYQSAPEERTKTAVTPSLGEENYFYGAVEMEEKSYACVLKAGAGDHMNVRIEQGGQTGLLWNDNLYEEGVDSEIITDLPSIEEAGQRAGITAEEAVRKADELMKELGLTGFSAKKVKLALQPPSSETASPIISYKEAKAGYLLQYTRDLDGFPVTHELNYGGGLESMESTIQPWGYEKVEFVFNQEGLQYAQILNLYQIDEKQVENVQLKSFPEITAAFEQMVQIQNTDMENEQALDMRVDRVTLGYMRVYDPGADASSGLLVPVWDFFGERSGKLVIDGQTTEFHSVQDDSSFLTLNAADGTVINRSLGY